MESREDLRSILPFLPVILRSSFISLRPKAVESLKALSLGPHVSGVHSGEVFFDAILDLRESVGVASHRLAPNAAQGYALFFDELMPRMEARSWFYDVVPVLAGVLLRLPGLLEDHYRREGGVGKTGLRILASQEAGIVFLGQDLIAALLVTALFCLFPSNDRRKNNLPDINFDNLFAGLVPSWKQNQEQKIMCLINYFQRISSSLPSNVVSFERKVLPIGNCSSRVFYPNAGLWKNSLNPLCSFEVYHSGSIEEQQFGALEVDFANEYLGGGSLHRGCVQEEIRFMINPELIVGMLFLPSMGDNEAIEIVGAERYSSYTGYASTFCFSGNFIDTKQLDSFGRRLNRIVAIDALFSPEMRQYSTEYLLREVNKAFCGFLDNSGSWFHLKGNNKDSFSQCNATNAIKDHCRNSDILSPERDGKGGLDFGQVASGIATGNWGCGAFGGDPMLKSTIQWLAASQALRPFIVYYTFGEKYLSRLEQATKWILEHEWTVGDLWCMLVDYSSLRLNGETTDNFFDWFLPPTSGDTSMDVDCMLE